MRERTVRALTKGFILSHLTWSSSWCQLWVVLKMSNIKTQLYSGQIVKPVDLDIWLYTVYEYTYSDTVLSAAGWRSFLFKPSQPESIWSKWCLSFFPPCSPISVWNQSWEACSSAQVSRMDTIQTIMCSTLWRCFTDKHELEDTTQRNNNGESGETVDLAILKSTIYTSNQLTFLFCCYIKPVKMIGDTT